MERRDVPGDIGRVSLEPIRYKNLVFGLVVCGGEDVGSLDGLREVSEDIVNEENGFGGIGWASDVCLFSPSVIENLWCSRAAYRSSSHQWSHIFP